MLDSFTTREESARITASLMVIKLRQLICRVELLQLLDATDVTGRGVFDV